MNYGAAVDKFLNYLEVVKNASEHTLRGYGLDLKGFRAFFKEDISIHDVDKRSIRGYLAKASAKGATKKTILRRLSTLRSFYKYLIKERLIEHSPLDEIDSPKLEKKIPPSLTYAQVEHLFEQPQTSNYLGFRDRCIMELFYSSGLRISELAALNRRDFDERNRSVRVMGKGKKERVVPITNTAAKWIMGYLNHSQRDQDVDDHKAQVDAEAIFLNKWGKRITVRSIDRNFEAYFKAAIRSQRTGWRRGWI
jgi:integrase/recombinase XerC